MSSENCNVIDKYKVMSKALIKEDVSRNTFPYSILMCHINGDFNISTFIRNGNAFGAREIFYYGKKKWDRRGSVGCHNYKQITHLSDIEQVISLSKDRRLIAIENNIPETIQLSSYKPQQNDICVFGEESNGIPQKILEACSEYVHIPQYGSVRSLNVGTASGIIMNHLTQQLSISNV